MAKLSTERCVSATPRSSSCCFLFQPLVIWHKRSASCTKDDAAFSGWIDCPRIKSLSSETDGPHGKKIVDVLRPTFNGLVYGVVSIPLGCVMPSANLII
ncbi:hypothetical protein CY34DRAFT_691610 [Suillus luteus UH-Slu-Lm8-n1]|uniref:Uncharacterized protein n=1 Tax=Suillus luteus UH-Slu-Lm8-n1 TaxID=930992 RepID=A0A0D0AHA0_9AGAM|nr:hypothetical protein CY34DRAFT_691610 [Suillus luteus UH-Slu-Lm8-n1]